MHIKKIAIQGFKSYKDQTTTEPFSPHHNVVVGRNGSGKTVRFVLSDAYTNMSREERQALLHEGSGPATMSAFVEIIFDNSDNRFPTGKEETIIRRTIGLKKDEYSLDKKSATKSDIMNLLESAGFSRSNPYYIVPQGRVTLLTHAKDSERLALLKEVAGTRVYEARRQESLKIIEDTGLKKGKIDELLEFISERLSELESEKQELQEFQKLDSDRRCLEYAIYTRELNDVMSNLEGVSELLDLELELRELKQSYQDLSLTRDQIIDDLGDSVRNRTFLESSVNEMVQNIEFSETDKESLQREIENVRKQISQHQEKLDRVKQQYSEAVSQEDELRQKFKSIEFEHNVLLQKQAHGFQFKSKKDRDSYLKTEISELRSSFEKFQEQLSSIEQDRSNAEIRIQEIKASISDSKELIEDAKNKVADLSEKEATLISERDEKTSQRKEAWKNESRLEARSRKIKEEIERNERSLTGAMDSDTRAGLSALRSLVEEHSIGGVFGPIYELFQVDDAYSSAVEAIAGASLFHVVVDTDETAARIVSLLSQRRSGRLTFMPLNRIRPTNTSYPSASDAIPIINMLEFEPKFKKAFQHIFGKAIVCPDLEVASGYSRSHQLTAVTLHGDRVDKRGALSGGFVDANISRIEVAKSLKNLNSELEQTTAELEETHSTLALLDQDITTILGEIQVTTVSIQQEVSKRDSAKGLSITASKEDASLRTRILYLNKVHAELSSEKESTDNQLKAYQQELETPYQPALTPDEQKQLSSLTTEMDDSQEKLIELSSTRTELETQRNILETKLDSNLKLLLDSLEDRLERYEGRSSNMQVRLQKKELSRHDKDITALKKSTKDTDRRMEETRRQIEEVEQQLETLKTQSQQDFHELNKTHKSVDKYLSQRNLLVQKKEECMRNIRDLGVLPEEAFQKYVNKSSQKLLKKLHKANSSLQKYSHVNKKAFEQYANFTDQRDELLKRKGELDDSARSIQQLIDVLDQQKDETIERTFKQVAKYFSEVFEKLVPSGMGQLIMQRTIDRPEASDNEDYGGNDVSKSIESYIGVSIKVSFNSKTDEGVRMQQLSGGQKSLVALALIFAIQRCDPAPFYLFDEIDANLDAVYRTSVANMIHELSENCQFITTTFRPEMLAHADQFYGVTFENKIQLLEVYHSVGTLAKSLQKRGEIRYDPGQRSGVYTLTSVAKPPVFDNIPGSVAQQLANKYVVAILSEKNEPKFFSINRELQEEPRFATIVRTESPAVGSHPTLVRGRKIDPTGREEKPEEEKSFIMKYWYIIVPLMLILLLGGGEEPQGGK
ncbi:Structural maintenance of chromosomes protein 3 [Mycoemilia scoparia]|uniref:Structural maintenance of chromosomes protein n=1 Tax=Mycoemilia scoparia TaxID=417184 RepID=A0A9W8A8K4_9FUNG|nr:Structural maintenance of chromosomes protein 3 [Mycoemilia scoparia]